MYYTDENNLVIHESKYSPKYNTIIKFRVNNKDVKFYENEFFILPRVGEKIIFDANTLKWLNCDYDAFIVNNIDYMYGEKSVIITINTIPEYKCI